MMNTTKIVLAAGTAMAATSMASAQHLATFNNVISDVPGDTRTTNAPSFTVGSLSWNGDVNSAGSGSYLSELTINATSPTSGPIGIQAGTSTTWSGNRNVSGWAAAFGGEDAAGTWSFEFTESFDDAGVDATWGTASVYIDNSVLPSFASFQAVNSSPTGYAMNNGDLLWVTFTHTGGPLSATTAGSTLTGGTFGPDDTEIGLYDAAGILLGSNDDEDFANNILTSRLDFANLPAGTYGVAIGTFNTEYADGYAVTSGLGTGIVQLTLIPTPATAALFGMAGLAGIRRRRA